VESRRLYAGNVLDMGVISSLRRGFRVLVLAGFPLRGRTRGVAGRRFGAGLPAFALGISMLGGCSHLRPGPATEYVYVTAKQTFLRDRVAAVSNRTGTVENGEKLEVLEHGRRFFRVKTEKGEIGWISEKSVATQDVYDGFQALAKAHKNDPSVASAVVRDEVNLHMKAGRETEVFYQLPEGDKLQLLVRATLPKPTSGATPAKPAAAKPGAVGTAAADAAVAAPPIAMEDWWLARDVRGRTGWLLSRMVDVDAPDSVSKYAEGQRIVGAYVLTTVYDPDAPADQPDKNIPMYLTLMVAPHTAGLPYDFDQVRVFTWNLKMHRYETAFREKNIEGYLPVKVDMEKDPYGKAVVAQTPLPAFTYRVLPADSPAVVPDPLTGVATPGRTISKTYRLEGNLVRRVAPPGYKDEPEAHPMAEEKKATAKVGKKKR
jgi:hypothetical protein